MNFKKYIYIFHEFNSRYDSIQELKINIKKGITPNQLKADLATDWIPDKAERLYFFPGCSVPRFKVRKKFNVTIKPEYATSAFISPSGLQTSDSMFDVYNNVITYNGILFGEYLTRIYGDDYHFVIKYKSLLLNCEDEVIIHDTTYNKIRWGGVINAIYPINLYHWVNEQDVYIESRPPLDAFYCPVPNSDISLLTCEIYNQDAILKIINEDSLIINENKYMELRTMANSSDAENVILVMELMSNADYAKSFVYLMLLLKEFEGKISSRKKEINHVNFKALLTYLSLEPRTINNISLEMLTAGMKHHKQFTRSNVQRITQFFIGTHINFGGDFEEGPVLKPDLNDTLDDYMVEEDEIHIPEDKDNDNFNL